MCNTLIYYTCVSSYFLRQLRAVCRVRASSPPVFECSFFIFGIYIHRKGCNIVARLQDLSIWNIKIRTKIFINNRNSFNFWLNHTSNKRGWTHLGPIKDKHLEFSKPYRSWTLVYVTPSRWSFALLCRVLTHSPRALITWLCYHYCSQCTRNQFMFLACVRLKRGCWFNHIVLRTDLYDMFTVYERWNQMFQRQKKKWLVNILNLIIFG